MTQPTSQVSGLTTAFEGCGVALSHRLNFR